ncbi:Zinc-binding dehydrogenase [Verrucomicrobium sp. GAS474]|uniref:zinc-binding dehydrogenase n=1 Tax=Verrucomicrobium sp. GAS474 TaxID=1882831 RepID=UPI00087C67F5|nr:zinc-binding dehydrogenase [Verrucomicrobium sp. GAS474]SDT98843.1 Zinc-binding dehydrogenase [Verrucomicrobium sp. GAS474]
MKQVAFTAHRQAEVVDLPDLTDPLNPGDIRGRTVISLTSPGTELNWGFLGKEHFPGYPGYASVFRVDEVASDVTDIAPGTLVYASGRHRDTQQVRRADAVPLPAGLAPEAAVFARLMGVSMSTLTTTTARPPARVLITGLGPVGNLAAQIFSTCGYRVTAVDPVESRRESARKMGLADVRPSLEATGGAPEIVGQIALHVECSGHEQAVLDGCKAVGKRGEVVMVGVPWRKRTDLAAFDILHAVFHKYAVLRSGWEWEVPGHPTDFRPNSLIENYRAAIEWIASGRINLEGMASCYAPSEAQKVYSGLLDQSLPTPAALFDWRS